jgi:hypothetical protein
VSGVDVGSAVVDITCSAASGPAARHDELLVGLERTSASGGGWNGFYVDYAVAGRAYRLMLRDNIAVCGVATDSPACAQYRTWSPPPSE